MTVFRIVSSGLNDGGVAMLLAGPLAAMHSTAPGGKLPRHAADVREADLEFFAPGTAGDLAGVGAVDAADQ